MTEPSVTIVIAIKDWEPERLDLAVRSHLASTFADRTEILVSDFGSTDPGKNRSVCEKLGIRYIYTAAEVWSRSQALNAGLSAATSDLLITTDADIIFAPRTVEEAVNALQNSPNALVLAQCNNLNEDYSLQQAGCLDWNEIRRNAKLRPRWGMGGLCAFSRDTFEAIRGFDERMTVWGAEDNDFVKRARQYGQFIRWIDGPGVGIYHVWHPPFLQTAENANEIFARNKAILDHDNSTVRNYVDYQYFRSRVPLVSINIATFNRGHLIADTIRSVLNQTVQDFEILIYDDGSTDDTQSVVSSFCDPRIRLITGSQNCGVASARNRLVAESRGRYVCVHDDDDLMLPNRLELQLAAITVGFVGSYGGWIDFDDRSGQIERFPGKKPFSVHAIAFVRATVLHPTLLIRTDVIRRFQYEVTFTGGSDFNLIFRLARAGCSLAHCDDYVILRRRHEQSLTSRSESVQKNSAALTIAPYLNAMSSHVERTLRARAKEIVTVETNPTFDDEHVLEFLPETLFHRLIEVRSFRDSSLESSGTRIWFWSEADGKRLFLLESASSRAIGIEEKVEVLQCSRIPCSVDPADLEALENVISQIPLSKADRSNHNDDQHATVRVFKGPTTLSPLDDQFESFRNLCRSILVSVEGQFVSIAVRSGRIESAEYVALCLRHRLLVADSEDARDSIVRPPLDMRVEV